MFYWGIIYAMSKYRRFNMSDELFSTKIKELRESTGLNRKEFCEKFEIPYRTMTEWELGHRNAPPYLLRLLSYYIEMHGMQEKYTKERKD